MRHRRRLSPTAAAVAVFVLIAAATYLAFGGALPWHHDYLIKAVVRNASELQSRSPVRIAGVNVGHVTKVERGPGSTAIVTMAIADPGLPIHRDATLKIRPRLFLEGNFFVDLQPGTPSAPNLGEGGTIPLSQTANPVQLDEVLTSLQSSTRDNLRSLVRALSQSLESGGAASLHRLVPAMDPALLDTAQVMQAVQGQQPGDLRHFVDDGERTARALSEHDRQLADLVTGLDRTVTTLAARSGAVAASVSGLDDVVGQAPPTLSALDRLFPSARAFVAEARPGIRALPATLRLANPLLGQLGGLIAPPELPALLDQLDPSLRSLSKLEPQLGTLLARVRPVTECLRAERAADPEEAGRRSAADDGPAGLPRPARRAGRPLERVAELHGRRPRGALPRRLRRPGRDDRQGAEPRRAARRADLRAAHRLAAALHRRPPPFRPDVPCTSQQPPDLAAQTGPAPAQSQAK